MNYGKVAYEGYCLASGNKSLISGQELPTWDKLDDKIKVAWVSAAAAVANTIHEYNMKMNETAVRGFNSVMEQNDDL